MSQRRRLGSHITEALGYLKWIASGRPFTHGSPGYDAWMEAYDPLRPDAEDIGLISVICPVHDPDPGHLEAAIRSVVDQTYEQTELVLVDDGSTSHEVKRLLESVAARPGVRLVTNASARGIVDATNAGVEASSGEYLVFLDHDDVLAPDALAWIAVGFTHGNDVVYSDEDQLDPSGNRVLPFMKPAWSPTMLLGMNYVNHATAITRSTLASVGGLRAGTAGAQDHDLLLRIAERGAAVGHIPKVLYHWRQSPDSVATDAMAKPWALDAARHVVASALERWGIDATVVDADEHGPYRFWPRFADSTMTIDVLSDAEHRGVAAIDRVLSESKADVIVIAAGSQVPHPDVIRQLAGWVSIPGVATAGPVIASDRRAVQEAGWIVDRDGARPVHVSPEARRSPLVEVARDVTAVGGACVAFDVRLLHGVGHLDGTLPWSMAIVDMSARMTSAGLRAVVDPSVSMHPEQATVSAQVTSPPTIERPDPFVSPHAATDGVTLDVPPSSPQARLERLRVRSVPRRTADPS